MCDSVKGILQGPERFSVKWKIHQLFTDCENGSYYLSPEFSIHYANQITKWHLRVYPKGRNEENKNHVSLFLYFSSETEIKLTVDYKLSMVSPEGNLVFRKAIGDTFQHPVSNWGWSKFAEQSFVKDTENEILIDGTFTILCEIIFCPPSDPHNSENFIGYNDWLDKVGNGVGDCEQLLESGNFSDVMFNVQDQKIKSHKAILSCCSPVFKAMFEHDMKENKQNVVDVADVNYDIMMELLRFIYSGKVKNIEEIASDLLIAADKYQIIGLKALCENALYKKLTIDNVVEYLNLTDMCDTIHLKRIVIKFAAAHQKDIVDKPGFQDLNNRVMYQIMLAVTGKD